ncbi:MAG: alpha/beta fold hydrolase [Pseudomonadota bacterium]
MARFFVLCLLILSGCAPRGEIAFAPPAPDAEVHRIWSARFQSDAPPAPGDASPPRPVEMTYHGYDISIPPGRWPGSIQWPRGTPDAATDFVTLQETRPDTLAGFARDVAASDTGGAGETVLFVHGFNATHGESVYLLAQMVEDFGITAPAVAFTWPSAGVGAGYLYDRDSVLYSRDTLEDVIEALTKDGRRLLLVGHSMGNQLIMETLRQMALRGTLGRAEAINGLFMISPDIDPELFQSQASAMAALPDPTVILVAQQDLALSISAFLTGRRVRLGTITSLDELGGLPVTIVDVSALADGRAFNHRVITTSASAIAILNEITAGVAPGETPVRELLVLGPR